MSDIAMCPGDGCPIRNDCYRFTAPRGEWQSYFAEMPGYWITTTKQGENGKWECFYYLPEKQGAKR